MHTSSRAQKARSLTASSTGNWYGHDEFTWVDPRDLVHPARLDVIVKYLYFRSIHSSAPDPDAARLYGQHIARRTGGHEGDKRTVADYHQAAARLMESIATEGFDTNHAVPIGAYGFPEDGAHRLAACLALGRPVAVRRGRPTAPPWDYDWFKSRGFPADDLDWIVRTYARLSNRIAVLIFWGPTLESWPTLMERLAVHGRVVGWQDLALDPADLASLVHDVYAYTLGPRTNERIETKARALAQGPSTLRAVLLDAGQHGAESGVDLWTARVKADLRNSIGRGPDDFFNTVHASDSLDETRYLVDLLFNANSLRQLATRRGRGGRPQFLEWLVEYRAALTGHDIRREDACIVGSAVLEAVGLREATDIDCIVAGHARREKFHNGIVALAADVDLVTAGYHRRSDDAPVVTDDGLVDDPRQHFFYRGFKFANPELVIDRKRQQARPKDLADVALWDARPGWPGPERHYTHLALAWDTTALDVVHQARWQTTAATLAQSGTAVILAGPPRSPSFFTLPCIEGPPDLDEVPACILTDPDPLATLEHYGVNGKDLLATHAAQHGWPVHPGQALHRLGAMARIARWMNEWLTALEPDVVVVPPWHQDTSALLLEAVARSCEVPLARDTAEAEMLVKSGREDVPLDAGAYAAACRVANEWTVLVRAAAGRTRTGEQAPPEQAGEVEELRATVLLLTATTAGRAVWIWGAGSAGSAAAAWLNRLGVRPTGAIDSDPSKRGKVLGSLKVSAPDDVLGPGFLAKNPVVLVASMHAAAIVQRLHDAGASDAQVLVAPSGVIARRAGTALA
jgi:hypothetical protein